jgi:acyl-CoA dehydrogenase
MPADTPGYSVTGTIELMGTASPGVYELASTIANCPRMR